MRYVRWRAPEVEAVDTIMLGGFGLLLLIPHLILLLIKTRFIIPVIYSLIVDIHFHEWEAAHHDRVVDCNAGSHYQAPP